MKRYYRWFKTALISVLFACVFASSASAIGYSAAWTKAWNDNWSDCQSRGYGLYSCQHANYPWPPTVYLTNANAGSGQTQWTAIGSYTQTANTPYVANRLCNVTERIGPYGGQIGIDVSCAANIGIG